MAKGQKMNASALFDALRTRVNKIAEDSTLLANKTIRQSLVEMFHEMFIKLQEMHKENKVTADHEQIQRLFDDFRGNMQAFSTHETSNENRSDHSLLTLLLNALKALELILNAMGFSLAKKENESEPWAGMETRLNRNLYYNDALEKVMANPPGIDRTWVGAYPVEAEFQHLNRDHLTEAEHKSLDQHINAYIENAIAERVQQRGDHPVQAWETRGVKGYDPSEGAYGLARIDVNSNRDYYVSKAEKTWLASEIGAASKPGQASLAAEAHARMPINRQELNDLERADLDFRTPSILKGTDSTEAIRNHLGALRWANDQYDDHHWGDAANEYASRADATRSITEQDIHEFRTRTLREVEQNWLKTPVGKNSKPGQVADSLRQENESHWTSPSGGKNNASVESSGISGTINREKLSTLERADLDFRTPSILKGESSSEAIRNHLGEMRWAEDQSDDDHWEDFDHQYSSRADAIRSVTEQDIHAFREHTLKAVEESWLKTPVGQNSIPGKEAAESKTASPVNLTAASDTIRPAAALRQTQNVMNGMSAPSSSGVAPAASSSETPDNSFGNK